MSTLCCLILYFPWAPPPFLAPPLPSFVYPFPNLAFSFCLFSPLSSYLCLSHCVSPPVVCLSSKSSPLSVALALTFSSPPFLSLSSPTILCLSPFLLHFALLPLTPLFSFLSLHHSPKSWWLQCIFSAPATFILKGCQLVKVLFPNSPSTCMAPYSSSDFLGYIMLHFGSRKFNVQVWHSTVHV